MEYRRSQTLIFAPDDGGAVSFNFLTKSTFLCDLELLKFLGELGAWTDRATIAQQFPEMSAETLNESLNELVKCGALTTRGSDQASQEEEFDDAWAWGIPAAMLHFGVQNNEYISLEEAEEKQIAKLDTSPAPELYTDNSSYDDVVPLTNNLENSPLLSLMAKRRTNREVSSQIVQVGELADCLFAGLGIIGTTANCAGDLPLSMTPSGGARNPFEAYVYVNCVNGLASGTYHYSAIDHTLGSIRPHNDLPPAGELVGDQDWMNDMACVIFLVGQLERSMWKYDDANAYRVVLIEAGHIAQNIMLAATEHNLTACPSAALAHEKVKDCFELKGITTAPMYALGMGVPSRH